MVTRLPTDGLLAEVIRCIVMAVQPVRIVLFGSAARGALHPHSDLDLLVVMPSGTHRRHTAQRIYQALAPLGVATDVVVVTESDVHDHADDFSLVLYPALREGKELYAARR